MDNTTRARLHDLTLKARHLLTAETAELLEGVYGLHADGRFEPAETLPALQALPEARETRARLERLLDDERAAGLSPREAVEKLTQETAFTWLNRVAAFKMLEARKLLRQSVAKGQESNGFKLWLTQSGNERDLERYEAGSLPQDALGEGPRDTAYRRYLIDLCREMAAQISVLFDPDTLASRLFPRPRALAELLAQVNAAGVAPTWAEDETIGWIYQYFNEQEKAEVFARLNNGEKIKPDEIPAATELFTPRWIVRALVHNSLGRLWVQMHPDTRLRERLDYLIPDVDAPAAPVRPVREITLLDPACGTMHFGLVAFDLFAEMYREELDHAGVPGWPEKPSVREVAAIPAAILEHNLFGIDIDLRAVQLSALTLYLKARTLNSDAQIRHTNLACADVRLLDGERLDGFLRAMRFTRPIYERVIRAVWRRLRDANQLGSLLRLEEEIRGLVLAERERYRREGEGRLPFPELRAEFEEEAAKEEYWSILEQQIVQAFDEFARQQAGEGVDQTYFAGEATKGMRLLDIMLRRYDVVCANPPYMGSRNMSTKMNDYLKKEYPASKRDLYAAFIDRCAEMLAPGGRLAMITQQSFMFISSYEDMRAKLRKLTAIETMIHVGPRAFEEIGGEKVNTTLFALRAEPDLARRDDATGTYFRLVREPDAEAKRQGFERAVARLQAGERDPIVYRYRQGDFDAILGAPWVYWITPGLRRLFQTLPKLGDVGEPRAGVATGDNFHFVRFWWESGAGHIEYNCNSLVNSQTSPHGWFPYMKGGEYCKWWGNQEHVVAFDQAHQTILATSGNKLPSRTLYFHPGVTYSYLTARNFSARLSPGGFIFDMAGSSLFPQNVTLTLAVMNSEFAAYGLHLINPTVNFQVGDLARLPIPSTSSDSLRSLVESAIALARADSAEDETTYEFVAPPAWPGGMEAVAVRHAELARVEREIDEEVYRLYGISAADRAAIEAELAEPVAVGDEDGNGERETNGEDVAETSPAIGRKSGPKNNGGLTREALATQWVSYAVGIALGRFQPGVAGALGSGIADLDVYAQVATPELETIVRVGEALRSLAVPDGIAPLDAGRPDDLARQVVRALELLVGEGQAEALLRVATGGRPLGEWLAKDFFKAHVQQYRKRPIYWLLQSPGRRYGIYLFHERVTRDTLHLLRGARYLGGKLNAVRADIAEQRKALVSVPQGPDRRRLSLRVEEAEKLLSDLEAFDKSLAAITGQTNSRGTVVGWAPELDDGVLINLAPLYPILPSWSAEPKKCWEMLARGNYDWSHTAMRYWPDRVLAKCRANRSYAIAHGVEAHRMDPGR